MKTKTSLIAGFLVLVLVSLACNFGASGSTTSTTVPVEPTEAQSGGSTVAESAFVTDIVLAKNVEGDEKTPVDPTTTFGPNDIIHAVVQIQDAPADTRFKSEWYVTDVGDVADAGSLITEYEVTTDGSRNIDFSLTPDPSWPAGTYHVKILVNGEEVEELTYTVAE